VVSIEDNGVVGGCGAALLQELNAAGVDTPVRLYGIPQEFLAHAKRGAILERIGLTAQSIAREVVEQVSTGETDQPGDVTAVDAGRSLADVERPS
jgi:1-deoxy-D-xylulose-5-phosphate synthase